MKLSIAPLLVALCLLGSAADAQVSAGRYSGAPSYRSASSVRMHGRPSYSSSRVWVPGHYETIDQRVWVPGRAERVWIEPVYELAIGPCGTRVRILLSAGHWRTIHHPGHYELRPVRVYRPGCWVARGFHHDDD
jgi:hypothetical protein